MLVLIQQRALFFFKGRFLSFFLLLVDARATVDSLFLFFFSPPPSFLPLSPRAAMTRHFAAAISLLAVIVFLGIASYAQVSRRLFEARRSAEKGKNRNPRDDGWSTRRPCIVSVARYSYSLPTVFFLPSLRNTTRRKIAAVASIVGATKEQGGSMRAVSRKNDVHGYCRGARLHCFFEDTRSFIISIFFTPRFLPPLR